jgi:hypothetical protein
MRSFRTQEDLDSSVAEPEECFANLEMEESTEESNAVSGDETVQVTVVLRGRRGELQNPALGVTQLVLGVLKAQATEDGERRNDAHRVIDATGVAIAS